MKTLALVRHAKSSWDHPGVDDHDRPLNARGIRDAPRMAAVLAAQHPNLSGAALLSSTALRAVTTADAFASAVDTTVRLDERLYGATPRRIVELVSARSEASVIVVAHDPGLSDLARHWSRFPDDGGIPHMPTCAVAVFDFGIDDWRDLEASVPERWTYDVPRDSD
ncbi:SixA phosphatase family protein [Microbacterium sp.]|jgi:phosphohistidine phosphatase|uniref:SixA phosphatase family protein n=1 Tax=Microbacterium sp. TaxID=51671 RepID=UPI0037CB1C39